MHNSTPQSRPSILLNFMAASLHVKTGRRRRFTRSSAGAMETTRGNRRGNFHTELFFPQAFVSKPAVGTKGGPPLKARRLNRLAHLFCDFPSEFDFSYLMDDLRHWKLVHVRMGLLLRLFVPRAGRQRHTKVRLLFKKKYERKLLQRCYFVRDG